MPDKIDPMPIYHETKCPVGIPDPSFPFWSIIHYTKGKLIFIFKCQSKDDVDLFNYAAGVIYDKMGTKEQVIEYIHKVHNLPVATNISVKMIDGEVDEERYIKAELKIQRALRAEETERVRKEEIRGKQAQENEQELLRKLEEEETKAAQPKAKKEKKQKDKVEKPKTNPHPKQIKISEGIWQTNPKWVKWEKENK